MGLLHTRQLTISDCRRVLGALDTDHEINLMPDSYSYSEPKTNTDEVKIK